MQHDEAGASREGKNEGRHHARPMAPPTHNTTIARRRHPASALHAPHHPRRLRREHANRSLRMGVRRAGCANRGPPPTTRNAGPSHGACATQVRCGLLALQFPSISFKSPAKDPAPLPLPAAALLHALRPRRAAGVGAVPAHHTKGIVFAQVRMNRRPHMHGHRRMHPRSLPRSLQRPTTNARTTHSCVLACLPR